MLDRSPLASHSFTSSKGVNLHVCYQDASGNIKQSFYDVASGWRTSPNGIVGKADLNNGIAITGYAAGNEERVYYVARDGKIVERCWSAGVDHWFDGSLTGKFTAAHYSSLAAMTYSDGGELYFRVYYQDKNNIIREIQKNGDDAWTAGHSFPVAIQGSSITCTHLFGGTYSHFIYFQKPDTTFVEYITENGTDWTLGGFKSQSVYDPGASITAATFLNNHRIFTIDRDNKFCVTEFTGGSWVQTKQLTGTVPFSAAAATLVAGSSRIRVYIQSRSGQIAEWGTNDGKTYSQMMNPLPTN